MSYKTYECDHLSIDPALPKVVMNKKYLITLNELAHGDIKTLCNNQMFLSNNEIVANVALQCLFSIGTLHSLNYIHQDCHWGNFLFHVSKKIDGWFEYSIYGKQFFVKNCGYNIMIYDFGLIKQMDHSSRHTINFIISDYLRILNAFIIKKNYGWLSSFPTSYEVMSKIMYNLKLAIHQSTLKQLNEEQIILMIIDFYSKHQLLNRVITTQLPAGEIVLNKGHPYIITNDLYGNNKLSLKITPK